MSDFTVSGLTAYTAKATELLTKGVLFNEDYQNYSIQQGIQYKKYLNFLEATPTLQAGACGLTAGGTSTFTEKTIETVTYAYRDQFCKDTLDEKALTLPSGTLDGNFGPLIESTLNMEEINKIKQTVDVDKWLGTSGFIDGWFTNVGGNAVALDTYGGVTASLSNIDDIVVDFVNNITDAMWSRGVLTLHMSIAIFNLYKQNRLAANYFRDANSAMGLFEMWVFGYEGQIKIKAEAGLAGSNYMMLTWDKNLYIGTDQIMDIASAKWFFDENTDYLRFKSSFKFGTQTAIDGEIITNVN